MDRRKVVATVGIGLSLPGCLGSSHHGGIDTSIPAALEGLSFERLEQSDAAVDPGADPVIRVGSDGQRVTVEGNVYVGSSECRQAKLESVSVDDSRLGFGVAPGKSPRHPDHSLFNFSCTEESAPDAYRIESPIPADTDRIEVAERDVEGRTRLVSSEDV